MVLLVLILPSSVRSLAPRALIDKGQSGLNQFFLSRYSP